MSGLLLIDPPVGPYSDPAEIEAWIEKLQGKEDRSEVRQAIADAEQMLTEAQELRDRVGSAG